jgi:hypothetical protein
VAFHPNAVFGNEIFIEGGVTIITDLYQLFGGFEIVPSVTLRTPIRLHDDIESIGQWAFAGCIFTNFRVPPLINVISNSIWL